MYGYVVFLLLDLLFDLDILQQGIAYIGLELSTVQKWVDVVSGIFFYAYLTLLSNMVFKVLTLSLHPELSLIHI